MEYYILINDEKQGPFDLLGMIKKVKNGSLTSATLVSTSSTGPFLEAAQLDDVASIINEHANPGASLGRGNINMTLKAAILEGIDLWARRVMDYTMLSGLIMAVGFSLQYAARTVMPITSIIPTYIATVFSMALFFELCQYVLETKRTQALNYKEFFRNIRRTLPGFIGISAIISLFILIYSTSVAFGVLASFAMMITLTFLAFMPFLAMDSDMGVLKAAKLSFRKVTSMGMENFGVLLAVVSINLFVAIIPGLIMPSLLGIGLFVSLPVTISAIAYIYDQVFV